MVTLYRTEEIRALEAQARAALPAGTLMQRAGAAAAAAIHAGLAAGRHATPGAPAPAILVLCGPGDNGGDGFRCAAALRRLGHACVCWAPLPSGSADAQAARRDWEQLPGVVLSELPAAGCDVVVDALLGIGASRPLAGPLLAALRWTQAQGLPVVALDVPSGLDADTGNWIGGTAGAAAVLTVTFLGDKPGLHLREGLRAAGRVRVEDLGVAATGTAPAGRHNEPGAFAALLQRRPPDVHKGSFGSVGVVGGATGMVGAALLAGRAALCLGAGKVFVDCLGAPELAVDPLYPELMLRPGSPPDAATVLVAGCGMGSTPAALARLAALMDHPGPALFDADALNALAADAALRARLAARAAITVVTPHPGEAARLLQTDVAHVQADRVRSAVSLAGQLRAIVVLKGAGSVIADPAGRYRINGSGGPALASAGTGDVLAGIIGALLAQCPDALAAVAAGVWLHGRAADLHGSDVGLTAGAVAPLAARAWELARRAAAPGSPQAAFSPGS